VGDSYPESISDIDPALFSNIDLAIVPIAFGMDKFKVHDEVLSPRYTIISHVKNGFKEKFREIIRTDTATFKNKDVFFESMETKEY